MWQKMYAALCALLFVTAIVFVFKEVSGREWVKVVANSFFAVCFAIETVRSLGFWRKLSNKKQSARGKEA